jgi:hypothetical protein
VKKKKTRKKTDRKANVLRNCQLILDKIGLCEKALGLCVSNEGIQVALDKLTNANLATMDALKAVKAAELVRNAKRRPGPKRAIVVGDKVKLCAKEHEKVVRAYSELAANSLVVDWFTEDGKLAVVTPQEGECAGSNIGPFKVTALYLKE